MNSDESALYRVFERAQKLGLIGRSTTPEKEIGHADGLGRCLGDAGGSFCLDLGTGAGLPGLVLASRWLGTSWTLLDRRTRCGHFLNWATVVLGIEDRVEVLVQEARLAVRSLPQSVDLLVARAFGSPMKTAKAAVGFMKSDARLIITEPAHPDFERWPLARLRTIGLSLSARHEGPPAFVELRRL